MEILGERWTFVVLREVFNGVRRFDDMRRHTGDPPAGADQPARPAGRPRILRREPYQEPGQRERHEYRLTAKGFDLYPVLVADRRLGRPLPRRPRGLAGRVRPPRLRRATVGLVLRCADGHEHHRPPRRGHPPRAGRDPAQLSRFADARRRRCATCRRRSSGSHRSRVTIPTLASSPSTPRTGAATPRAPPGARRRRDLRRGVRLGPARIALPAAPGSAGAGRRPVARREVGPRGSTTASASASSPSATVRCAVHPTDSASDRSTGHGEVAQHRLDGTRQPEYAEPDVQPPAGVLADQRVAARGC